MKQCSLFTDIYTISSRFQKLVCTIAIIHYLDPLRTGVDCISYSKNSQVQNSDGSSSPICLRASAERVTLVMWISNRF